MKKTKIFFKKKSHLMSLSQFVDKNFSNTFYVPDSIFTKLIKAKVILETQIQMKFKDLI